MKEDKHMKALQIVRIKGPVIPSQINKEINVDVITGSAILSELVDKGQLKISSVKVGNSPLYYAPGQESRLQQFTNQLNAKDKETLEMLRQKGVLRDKSLDTLRRVSLRQIKDFAKPITVRVNNEEVLFWKWYLLSNEEAGEILKTMLPQETKEAPKKEPDKKLERVEKDAVERQAKQLAEERKKEKQEKLGIQMPAAKAVQFKKEEEKESVKEAPRDEFKETDYQKDLPKDKFFRRVKKYLDDNRIKIIDYKINRKESDMEFTVEIPSPVGSLKYFCKAKNKAKLNDGDLGSVFIEGQRKKMPILFLVTGELTKKAKDVLDSEFKSMSVRTI